MKKNNIWNRIFHTRNINKNVVDYKLQQSLVDNYENWLIKIDAANTLSECMILHKRIWYAGFQNKNLAPDEFGMFRTKDIDTMTINEVYLGGIYGLNTLTIAQWEEHDEDMYNSQHTCYSIILESYKKLLRLNILDIKEKASKLVEQYQKKGY